MWTRASAHRSVHGEYTRPGQLRAAGSSGPSPARQAALTCTQTSHHKQTSSVLGQHLFVRVATNVRRRAGPSKPSVPGLCTRGRTGAQRVCAIASQSPPIHGQAHAGHRRLGISQASRTRAARGALETAKRLASLKRLLGQCTRAEHAGTTVTRDKRGRRPGSCAADWATLTLHPSAHCRARYRACSILTASSRDTHASVAAYEICAVVRRGSSQFDMRCAFDILKPSTRQQRAPRLATLNCSSSASSWRSSMPLHAPRAAGHAWAMQHRAAAAAQHASARNLHAWYARASTDATKAQLCRCARKAALSIHTLPRLSRSSAVAIGRLRAPLRRTFVCSTPRGAAGGTRERPAYAPGGQTGVVEMLSAGSRKRLFLSPPTSGKWRLLESLSDGRVCCRLRTCKMMHAQRAGSAIWHAPAPPLAGSTPPACAMAATRRRSQRCDRQDPRCCVRSAPAVPWPPLHARRPGSAADRREISAGAAATCRPCL